MEADGTDYLAGIGDGEEGPFARAVREAFRGVHGCPDDRAIAERMGVSAPAVSGLMRGAPTMNAKRLRGVLARFSSFEVRRRIVAAWEAEALGESLSWPEDESPGEDPLARVEALIGERQLERALRLATRAADAEEDASRKFALLDRAIYLGFRLDDPVAQAGVAASLVRWGESRGDRGTVALGLAVSARAMRRSGAPRKAVSALRRKVLEAAAGVDDTPGVNGSPMVYARDLVESENVGDLLDLHRSQGGQEETLESLLGLAAARRRKATTGAGVTRSKVLEASIHLALGRRFRAEELLDEAYEGGGGWRGTGVYVGLLKGRILAERGEAEEAAAYYRRLAEACTLDRDEYLGRLARQELAWLLAPR